MPYERESVRELKRENRELRRDLEAVAARLQAETARVALAQKAARDAWSFAKVAFHGRSAPRT